MFFNQNALRNKIQHYKKQFEHFFFILNGDKKKQDKKLDQAVKESFPASDPIGFNSKSAEDAGSHP